MTSCLLLNADASPVSLLPLSTISWEEAIQKMVTEKAIVLEWYDDWIVHSEKWSTPVPAVMILKEYQKKKTAVRFSKHNVFLRDGYTCQYCGDDVTRKSATLDHVLPASHGGKTTFENTVCACAPCNANKGNNKKIVPKAKPYKPTYFQLAERRKRMHWDHQHPSWANYLEY
jgi:5-methylcytosine-specific restriction endonuclease McrA